MDGNTLGTRITERLQDLQMTQKDLAARADVTEAAVSHYIKGDRYPRSSVLVRLAEALDVTADYLMGGNLQDRADAYTYYYRKALQYQDQDRQSQDLENAVTYYDKALKFNEVNKVNEISPDQQYYSEDLDMASKLITRNLSQMTQEDKLKIMKILLDTGDRNPEEQEEN